MIDKSKAKGVKTLGSNTEGEGSERYQLVKKMVISGALSGSHDSLRYSGLFIGTATASKYRAALIRDGVINGKQATVIKKNKQEEIRETQKFDDFTNFCEAMRGKKGAALADAALADAALAFIKIFEKHIECIEYCLLEYGQSRTEIYRTGIAKSGEMK